MQDRVQKQTNLEDEILKKVELQYNQLKGIIDQHKDHANKIIKNLESVQSYKPPPSDLTEQTLKDLEQFHGLVGKAIQQIKKDNEGSKFIDVLNMKALLQQY